LGLHKIARAELEVELISFTEPPDGVAFQDPTQNKPKLAYYAMDAPRMTMRMGLPIVMPNPFDVDFTAANRALIAAVEADAGLPFALAVADARWGEGENVSDLTVLERCAESVGLSSSLIASAQSDQTTLIKHRALVEEDQVFGVPFAVYGASKYWGHDRFYLMIEDIKNT